MTDLLAWFGLKRFPFDKTIKSTEALDTEPVKECAARLDYIKRRGGIMLLTGDPGVGKTLVLGRYVDTLNENLFRVFYTPLSTLSRADLLCHINRLPGLPTRISKSATYLQIQNRLIESREQLGKTVFLIIDEAHLLQTGPLERYAPCPPEAPSNASSAVSASPTAAQAFIRKPFPGPCHRPCRP